MSARLLRKTQGILYWRYDHMLREVQSRITRQKEINPDYIERRLLQLGQLDKRLLDRFWHIDSTAQTALVAEKRLLKRYRQEK